MFAGIVETKSTVLDIKQGTGVLRMSLSRPSSYTDIHVGDSIATNGICLTIESFNEKFMTFAIGLETLKVTGWTSENLLSTEMNVERSLTYGDRVHGHLVTGHVDAVVRVMEKQSAGECSVFWLELPESLKPFIWPKGSVALNGVSLTVNEINQNQFSVCLIPETLSVTNLGDLNPNDPINVEVDNMARAFVKFMQLKEQNELNS